MIKFWTGARVKFHYILVQADAQVFCYSSKDIKACVKSTLGPDSSPTDRAVERALW